VEPTQATAEVSVAEPVQTVTAPRTAATNYQASIEQDQEGFTIVIDAPAETNIFKDENATPPLPTSEQEVQEVEHPIPTAPAAKTEVIHIVVRGDTLWHIAIRYLNNPYLYPELAKLSNIRNPDLIYPGNRVRIIKRSK
jgi:nucleoid-associated protein YgaU